MMAVQSPPEPVWSQVRNQRCPVGRESDVLTRRIIHRTRKGYYAIVPNAGGRGILPTDFDRNRDAIICLVGAVLAE